MSDNMDMPLGPVEETEAFSPPLLTYEDSTHEYRFHGKIVPSVTQIMQEVGASGDFRFVDPEVLEASRIRGHAAHDACYRHLSGVALRLSEMPESAVGFFDSFLEWQSVMAMHSPVEPLNLEVMVYDHEMGAAGRYDAIMKIGSLRWLIDFKTRRREKYDGIQLGGYARATTDRVDAIGVLELKKNGSTAKLHRFPLERSISAWEAVVNQYNYLHGEEWRYEAA